MERLGVGHFRPGQEVLLPLKSPSGHFAIGRCDNTAVRIKMKRESACIRDVKDGNGLLLARKDVNKGRKFPQTQPLFSRG